LQIVVKISDKFLIYFFARSTSLVSFVGRKRR